MTITDNANNGAVQEDSTVTPEAGETTPTGGNENQTPVGEPDDTEQHADDDAQDDSSRSNREKRYRLRLRDAERERDEARDLLARTRQAIVDNTVRAAGIDPRLMTAAGHTIDTLLGDDGLLAPAKLADAITATAREFRVPPRPTRPQANPQQGSTNGGGGAGKASWAGAIKGSE